VSQWAAEVKARGVADVAAALGLEVRPRSKSLGPCPACQAPRRHTKTGDHRGAVGLTPDGLGWRCFQCDAGGDAVTLAAFVALGRVPGSGDPGWREVAAFCETHGLCTPSTPGTSPRPRARVVAAPPPAPAPALLRPPAAEVAALWAACVPVVDDPDVAAWITGRGLDAGQVADTDTARALPRTGPLPPWCRFTGQDWRESTHRVIVPLVDAAGRLISLHARALAPATPGQKAASPAGFQITGLVFADSLGRALLEGQAAPRCVVIAEGVPDFLTWATRYGDAAEDAPAVLGVVAGSWTAALAARCPNGATVVIRTHADAAGDKYAAAIAATLTGRCALKRPRI